MPEASPLPSPPPAATSTPEASPLPSPPLLHPRPRPRLHRPRAAAKVASNSAVVGSRSNKFQARVLEPNKCVYLIIEPSALGIHQIGSSTVRRAKGLEKSRHPLPIR